jgi:hypothetical protein
LLIVYLGLVVGCGAGGVATNVMDGGPAGTTGAAGSAAGSAAGTTGGNHMFEDGFNPSGPGAFTGSGAAGSSAAAGQGLLGDWLYASGTTTRACPGEEPSPAPPLGGIHVAAGDAGELIVSEACALRFKLAGDVATIVDGQECAGSDGAGGQIAFSKMSWTLTLSSDGKTLSEALSADQILTPSNGPARTCRYTEEGVTLRRP